MEPHLLLLRQAVERALFPPTPVVYGEGAICQPPQLTPEPFVFWTLLPHGLGQEIALFKLSVQGSALRLSWSQSCLAIVVERLVAYRRQLRQVPTEEENKSPKHLVSMAGPRLSQPLINAPQVEAANHAFFVNDDGPRVLKVVLQVLQPFPFQRWLPATARTFRSPFNVQPKQPVCSLPPYKLVCRRVGERADSDPGPSA